jgi:hypothetical protein
MGASSLSSKWSQFVKSDPGGSGSTPGIDSEIASWSRY